jgi:hypothetical protein
MKKHTAMVSKKRRLSRSPTRRSLRLGEKLASSLILPNLNRAIDAESFNFDPVAARLFEAKASYKRGGSGRRGSR